MSQSSNLGQSDRTNPPHLERVTLVMCSYCLDGLSGECHTAGCAFWMNRAPDIPVRPNVESAEVLPDD